MCVCNTACFPGKRGGRLDGVVIDRMTSIPLPGATIHSSDPVNKNQPHPRSPVLSDRDGKFALPPFYGITRLLEMTSDIREITVGKEGYESEELRVTVIPQTNRRLVDYEEGGISYKDNPSDTLTIKLRKK